MRKEEWYPTRSEMMPWASKPAPISWWDGRRIFLGPKLGSQAPDDFLVAQSNQPQTTLYTLMDQTFTQPEKQFFILIFWGTDCADNCPNLKSIADGLEYKYGHFVDVFGVTPYYDHIHYDVIHNILGDPDGSCEQKYGATGPAFFVINRRKEVVWKSASLMTEKLYLYLNSYTDSV